jgi:hypothetical protein
MNSLPCLESLHVEEAELSGIKGSDPANGILLRIENESSRKRNVGSSSERTRMNASEPRKEMSNSQNVRIALLCVAIVNESDLLHSLGKIVKLNPFTVRSILLVDTRNRNSPDDQIIVTENLLRGNEIPSSTIRDSLHSSEVPSLSLMERNSRSFRIN